MVQRKDPFNVIQPNQILVFYWSIDISLTNLNTSDSAIHWLGGIGRVVPIVRWLINVFVSSQSELIGQCQATPHHLSDVRRGAPSWIWDYFSQSDVTICVLNAIYMLNFARWAVWRNWPNSSDCVFFKMFR